jgi:hypothetical protein
VAPKAFTQNVEIIIIVHHQEFFLILLGVEGDEDLVEINTRIYWNRAFSFLPEDRDEKGCLRNLCDQNCLRIFSGQTPNRQDVWHWASERCRASLAQMPAWEADSNEIGQTLNFIKSSGVRYRPAPDFFEMIFFSPYLVSLQLKPFVTG